MPAWQTMRALEYDAYGGIDRLVLRDVPRPTRARVVVRVVRAALNPKDSFVRKGRFRWLSGRRFPKRVGLDFAGEVSESGVPQFRSGDRVFGALQEWRFLRGTLAEFVAVRPNELAHLPDRVGFDEGAAIALVGCTSLQALRDIAQVGPGARVLVNGSSGGVGTLAIQIARRLGAHVTTVSSAANLSLSADLGAERTLDYGRGPWFRDPSVAASFDCIFDAFGNLQFPEVRRALAPDGTFVSTVPSPRRIALEAISCVLPRPERLVVVQSRSGDLEQLAAWLADGSIRAVIDSRFALARYVEAFARLETKRSRGKILIEVASPP